MMFAPKIGVLFLLILLTATSALAQHDCATIVQAALAATDQVCNSTGRNQVCYGNVVLQAVPQPGVSDFHFSQPGDLAQVFDVQTLTLSSRLSQNGAWGVALMNLQANLPNTLPGQNVTMLLFGQVEIENAVASNVQPPTVEVSAASGVNIRSGPATTYAVVGSLAPGNTLTADGRLEDGSWLRVQLPDNQIGWVSAQLVTTNGDSSQLEVTGASEATPEPPLQPMQAFYFTTGIGDRPCAEAPDSGILIQTPQGAGKVTLTVNEVNISLGSTAYLQAQPGGQMSVSVVEGQAEVSAFTVARTVPAGARVGVPLDNNAQNPAASGPPGPVEPYDGAALQSLPVNVLPRIVTIAPPAVITEATPGGGDLLTASGQWQMTMTDSCIANFGTVEGTVGQTFRFEQDGAVLIQEIEGGATITWTRVGEGVYTGEVNGLPQTFQIVANNHFIQVYHDQQLNCDITMEGVVAGS
jgi:SH3 domain-containing protein